MGYLYLLLTILVESAAVVFMKLSNGFHDRLYGVIAVACYALTFVFLTLALKSLPAGMANAIWAGTSTVLVIIAGIIFFHEKLTVVQIVSLGLIVAGLVGLGFSKP